MLLLGRTGSEWLGWLGGLALTGWLLPWWLGIAFADQNLQLAFAGIGVLLAAPAVCSGALTHRAGAALGFASFLVLMVMDTARIWRNSGGLLLYLASWRMFLFGAAAALAGAGVAAWLGARLATPAGARQANWAVLAAVYLGLTLMPEAWRWEFIASLQPGAPVGVFAAVVAALAGVYLIFSSFSTRPSRM